jgi:hypothetical protein
VSAILRTKKKREKKEGRMFWFLFLLFLFGGAALFLLSRNVPKKIYGIYSRPTMYFPLKFILMKFVISRRQKKSKENQHYVKSNTKVDILNGQFGGDIRNIEEMEHKQCLPKEHPMAGDCVFFDASNANGWWLTIGMAQRSNNIINLFFILKVPGLGTFVNEELPHTSNVKSIQSETEYLTESGFRIYCIEAMKKWHISFNGFLVPAQFCQPNLKRIGSEIPPQEAMQKVASSFELIWENHGEYFDFDVECSPEAIARSIATEPWSKELFEKLKATHQTHYEQFGKLKGVFNVGEFRTPTEIVMTSMRDHTITKYRNWAQIRRYIMIIYHLEDGTCIHTSVISMPETVFTQLQFGYVITPELKKLPVDYIDLQLPYLGENKKFPKKFHYSFRAGNMNYDVNVESKDMVNFKMGETQACYIEENMCEFVANGKKGYGFAEVEYRIEPY